MNINAARAVDFYLGVPLCFIGSLVARILPRRARATAPGNVLFIELSEMGSVILAEPAMRKLKAAGAVNLHFATFRRNGGCVELLGLLPPENVFLMPDPGLETMTTGVARFLAWTRRKRIDTVIDLELFSRFTALLSGFSGAARRVGFDPFHTEGLYRGAFLTHRVLYNPHQHIIRNYLALAHAASTPRRETPYAKCRFTEEEVTICKAEVSAAARAAMLTKIRQQHPAFDPATNRIVVFNTDSSPLVPQRRWPHGAYASLARTILERHEDVLILLIGTADEHHAKETLVAAVGSGRCVNFAGLTSVAELPALFSVSLLMLSNDSGPAQTAALTGLPLFVFFGPESPLLYGPPGATPIYAGLACSPCVSAANHRRSPCDDNVCLSAIEPESVYALLAPHLMGRAPRALPGGGQ